MILFTLPGYEKLGQTIAAALGAREGRTEVRRFPNQERYLRVLTPVREEDVVLLGGTVDDAATLDIFDLGSGLVTDGCRSLKIAVPFFSYSTMERAVKPGEVVTAKTRARLLSAIPAAPFGNQVLLIDLHSEGIPFYFEGTVKTQHLYAKPVIHAEARRLGGANFVLGAVDAGRAKWVESLANDMGVPAGFVYKRREADGRVTVSGTNTPVAGLNVVIYDDMIRSGGSILQAARAYRDAGAREISVVATHADFTATAVADLKSSGLLRELVCTDTHPKAFQARDEFLRVVSVAPILIEALKPVAR